jgi:ketosteroid isomerase-like protein
MELMTGLLAGARELDKDALLAALPEMIPQICDAEIEWVEDPTRADGRIHHGHDGVRESWERWLENFEDFGFELESISDHGDRLLITFVEHARGRASSAQVSGRNHAVVSFRDGRILRYQEFYDERDALAALNE